MIEWLMRITWPHGLRCLWRCPHLKGGMTYGEWKQATRGESG